MKRLVLKLLPLKGNMKTRGFVSAAVMAGMMLMALGYFIYDGHQRGGGMMGKMMGMMMNETGRHSFLMSNGVPQKYAELSNPLPSSPENISAGKELYNINCMSCHGETGLGDGVAGKSLDPAPADLISSLSMPMSSDSFLYWSISAGGSAFNSAMPAFESVLNENERWQIITYLRQL